MDEIDLENASPEDINELESRLYAQIHHEPVVFEDRNGTAFEQDAELDLNVLLLDAPNPSPPLTERVVTQTRIVNNKTVQSLNHGRYWNKALVAAKSLNPMPSTSPAATKSVTEMSTSNISNAAAAQSKIPLEKIKNSPSHLKSSPAKMTNELQNKGKQQQQQQQQLQKKPQQKTQPNSADQKKQQTQSDQRKQQTQSDQRKQQNQVDPKPQQQQKKTQNIANQKPLNPLNVHKKAQQQQKSQSQSQQAASQGPFGKQAQKLEKLKRIEKKKEKSKQTRLNRIERLKKQQPTEIIVLSTSNDEDEEDDDDVVIVPLPPPAVIDVDDSNSNSVKDKCEFAPAESKIEISTTPYIEENAIDSSDVQFEKATMRKPLEVVIAAPAKQMSVCNSPSSSVLSTDDFIGQTDRRRLKEDFENVRADDEDLLMLTSDLGTFLKPAAVETQPTAANDQGNVVESEKASEEERAEEEQHDSEPEFRLPANLEAIKEKYRVEPSQFRALDVYESESDFNETGIYSKSTKTNPMATVIRPIGDSSSDEDLNELVEPSSTQKTKRLRKRRASSTNKDSDSVGHVSGSGGGVDGDNTDSDDSIAHGDGVQSTCVSFIARGVAVEHCKLPVRKLTLSTPTRASRSSTDADDRFLQSLKSLAKGSQADDESDSAGEATQMQVPSARDIAERVLKKQARNEARTKARNATGPVVKVELQDSNDEAEDVSVLVKIHETNNEALPSIACEGLAHVFEQIDSNATTEGIINCVDNSDSVSDDEPVPQYDIGNEAVQSLDHITSKDLRNMNDEMTYFYDKSWGGETFNLAQCLRSMDKRRQLWRIQPEDRFPRSTPRNNMKCLNCCEFGHVRAKCKQPKKPVVCHTCGCVGHQETRCPKSMCLGCGNRTQLFVRSCNNCSFQRRLICPLCKVRGHSMNTCPDKWRRYHSTTQMNVPLDYNVSYKRKKYCSICGAEGHLSDTCRAAPRFMDYPTIVSAIKSHEKVYENQTNCILMPKEPPHVPFHFNWSLELEKNGYYNRFLKAVGLSKMFKRKAKKRDKVLQAKKSRMLEESYVQNPYAQNATQKEKNLVTAPPNQVQEVSESGNMDLTELIDSNEMIPIQSVKENNSEIEDIETVSFNAEEYQVIDEIGEDTDPDTVAEKEEQKEQASGNDSFKEPMEVLENAHQPTSASQISAPLLISNIDSDSNYSFSDHFELPTSTTSNLDEVSVKSSPTPKINRKSGPMDNLPEIIPLSSSNNSNQSSPAPRAVRKSRPMEDLPEIIPLSSGNDGRWETNNDDTPLCTGISMCFAGEEPLNYEDVDDIPSEAKIFMQRSDTEFLFSPEGRQFLNDISKECNVDVHMKLTSCGHVLVIYGLPRNQTNLHMAVLNRCKDVRNKSIDNQSQKPPKRVDVLIKYMRDGICQLLGNIGSADDHYKQMKNYEKQNTKNGTKAADKKRRVLNMILIGQAGLLNGNMHLDQLVQILRKLIRDHQPDDVAPAQMRNEIEKHWRVIFTPYIHTDYHQLLKFYYQLPSKNRVHSLNLEPQLLGQKTLNTSLSEEQKSRQHVTPTKSNTAVNNNNNNNNTPVAQRKTTMQNNTHSDVNILPPPSYQKPAMRNGSGNKVTPLKPLTGATSTPFTMPRRGNMPVAVAGLNYPPSPFATPRELMNRQRMASGNIPTYSRRQCQQTKVPPPFANPQQRSAVSLQLHSILPSNANSSGGDALLSALNTPNPCSVSNRAQQASMFWSREALKYVDECLRLTDNSLTLTRLYRVQVKCRSGNLSHNDYLAVIKLYNILAGNEF